MVDFKIKYSRVENGIDVLEIESGFEVVVYFCW